MKSHFYIHYFAIAFLLLFSTRLLAQNKIVLNEDGLTAALQQSKIQHKPVFFMCYASWCPHCKKMKETVFADKEVASYYNQNFVCAGHDMEIGEGKTLHDQFHIVSYPTFIFMDSTGKEFYRVVGEFNATNFLQEGKDAVNPQKQIPFLKAQFEKDVSNPESCYDYLRALRMARFEYNEMLQTYFNTQKDEQLLSEPNWRLISNGTQDVNSREFQYLLHHQEEFGKIASPERVEKKITNTFKLTLQPLVDLHDTAYFEKRKTAAEIHLPKLDSLLFLYDCSMYENAGNWNAYTETTLKQTERYAWNDYAKLKEISLNYLQHVDDSTSLQMAIYWMNRSISLHEEYSSYLVCAKLYKKAGDTVSAIKMVKEAKNVADKYGWDHSEAETLLKEWKGK